MTEQVPEPTGDEIPDGTQLPTDPAGPEETGDAGVNDTGNEPWYDTGEPLLSEMPD